MAAADSRHIISCPNCGAKFAVAGSFAGRKARCDACNEAFVVPALGNSTEAPTEHAWGQPHEKTQQPSVPAAPKSSLLIGLECRVCGTRLYGRQEDVGKKIKCPDCGAGTEIPPPAKPKPLNMPAALFGEQYELWDADDAPLPSELKAEQPKYIAVTCKVCQSLMYATEDQVGKQMLCIDCGTKNLVPAPLRVVVRPSVLATDRDTPQLDPAAAPGDRPVLIPQTFGTSLAEQRAADVYARALEKSRRTGKAIMIDERGRPILPSFPLLTGILTFPFLPGVFSRWMALSLALLMAMFLMIDGGLTLYGGGFGPGLFAGLLEVMLGAVAALIWYASISNIVIAIISQSVVGADRMEDWPSMNFIYSMSEMLPAGIAMTFAGAPGWMLSKLLGTESLQSAALVGGSMILGLPLVMLSQQAGASTWDIIDLKVLGAMVRCPFSMLLFWLESSLLLLMSVVPLAAAWERHPYLPIAVAPIIVGCIILYSRILGRLGWRLAEKISVDELADDDLPRGPKNYNPPRGKAGAK